jgi:hypothetical protein
MIENDDRINDIIADTETIFKSIKMNGDMSDKIIDSNNYYDTDTSRTDLTSVLLPIYYFFDNDINDKIGSSIKARDAILNTLKINELLENYINPDNIININTSGHATLFYILEYKFQGVCRVYK